jgi:hypothetical protein
MEGNLDKMRTELIEGNAHYYFVQSEKETYLNPLVGQVIRLSFANEIHCCSCGKQTKKSYGGGYCYPCTIKLAECDMCILKPEQCHFHLGTCREPIWGEEHCMIDHFVYLANSSGLKVGITRHTQIPTRFIDQGAIEALPIIRVKTRYHSGLVEKLLSSELKDKTDWRKMLKGERVELSLEEMRDEVFENFASDLDSLENKYEGLSLEFLERESIIDIHYPVMKYPEKVASMSFDKTSIIEGKLEGIKGQYLIFDKGVINIRSHTGYKVKLEIL